MKIALIHGIGHQGSTWHYADLICQELDKLGPVEKSEFFYPGICPISVRDIERIPNPVFRSIFFRMMVGMEKKNDWNPKDRNHWDEKGWLYGKRPF